MFKMHVELWTALGSPDAEETKIQIILFIPPEFDYPTKKLTAMFINQPQ
jgi:hypothetical protein